MNETDLQPKKIRSRYVRNSQNIPRLQLMPRDIEILKVLKDYRFLTACQIQKLFFKTVHKSRRRLFKLWQNKYLERVFLPPKMGEGSPYAIYALGSRGVRLLVNQLGLDRQAIGHTIPRSKGSYLFIEHTLKRNDLRIALTLACKSTPNIELLFWRQDKSIKDHVTFINSKSQKLLRIPLMADGFFGLKINNKKFYFFVEIDRGSIDNKRILNRMKGYYNFWLQKRHIKKFGIGNFRVLTITTTQQRMENLIETTKKVRKGNIGSNLFWFTTFDRYSLENPKNIFEKIWRKAHIDNGNYYSILD